MEVKSSTNASRKRSVGDFSVFRSTKNYFLVFGSTLTRAQSHGEALYLQLKITEELLAEKKGEKVIQTERDNETGTKGRGEPSVKLNL